MKKSLLKFTKKTIKKFLYSVIYSYPGYLLYDFIQGLGGYKKERKRINKKIGYYPNLKNPQSFNEKVLWKKLYDRNPLLPIISDKYRVRDFIKERLGEAEANRILVPLLYVTSKPQEIPFDDLKGEYVIKPNHASGRIILAENIEGQKRYTIKERQETKIIFDCKDARDDVMRVCKEWISKPYNFHQHEWAYQKIKRKIIIEKLLRDVDKKFALDYKFTVFYGNCSYITVWYDRFVDLSMGRYTPEWEYISIQGRTKLANYMEKPKNLRTMIELAELLGKPFDYIRVDLYLAADQIYFGELTSYTASGTVSFPMAYDFELGSKWTIIPRYWKISQFLQ